MGPTPAPMLNMLAQAAMALVRSFGSRNMSVMMERVEGIIMAAPNPVTTRKIIRRLAEVETAEANEPIPKMSNPVCSMRLRP